MQFRTLRPTVAIATILVAFLTAPDPGRAQSWLGDAAVGVQARGGRGALRDARVEILYRGPGGETGGPAPRATNDQGQASFSGLAEGVWSLEVSHPDHLSFIATLSLRRGKKTDVVTSFLEASGAGRDPMRVKLFQPGSKVLGTPLAVAQTPPGESPPRVVTPTSPEDATPTVSAPEPPSPAVETPPAPSPAPPPEPKVTTPEPREPERQPAVAAAPAAVEPAADPEPEPEPAAEQEPEMEAAPELETDRLETPEPEKVPVLATPEPEPAAPPEMEVLPPIRPEEPVLEAPAVEPAERDEPAATAPAPREEADRPAAQPITAPVTPEVEAAPLPEPVTEPPPTETPPVEPPTVTGRERPAAVPDQEPPIVPPVTPIEAPEPPLATEEAPPPQEPPTPEVAPAMPAPLSGADASARSFRDRTCFECKPGEWAVGTSAEVATAGGCPADALDRAGSGVAALASAIGVALSGYGGSALDEEVLGRLDGEARSAFERRLGTLLEPTSACRLLVLSLPGGARMSGFRFEAFEGGEGGDCFGDQPCSIGESRWLASPGIERGEGATLLWAVFENSSSAQSRRARFVGYFTPPPGWRP